MPVLLKRDNMGFAIHPVWICLLIILGSMLVVMMGYSVHKLMGLETSTRFLPRTQEQEQYMVDVRMRNQERLAAEGRLSQLNRPRVVPNMRSSSHMS